ncbi:uncharacterized protein F10E9.5-like [Linepithema humile]|uniref:uncharacterized protein F10E9.5-like n=1 Tax=Linepithema humile TaxID=83485 RepID=UPI00062365DE|nr:PREDICTED: uncharacterized protein F10E9.5-like [Linepithema humile]
MEFVATKRSRKWKKKRYLKKRLRERTRVEVRSAKHCRVFPKYIDASDARETLATGTMQADSFWANYGACEEWQKRHSVTWWRSRCIALEHENEILRNKLRSLAQHCGYSDVMTQKNNYHEESNNRDAQEAAGSNSKGEDLEFHVTEDMLNFFETSERHRRELQKHKSKNKTVYEKEIAKQIPIMSVAESARAKKEEAALLYGDASSKILTIETTLQAAVDKYKDTANPQYWPNIPLKP